MPPSLAVKRAGRTGLGHPPPEPLTGLPRRQTSKPNTRLQSGQSFSRSSERLNLTRSISRFFIRQDSEQNLRPALPGPSFFWHPGREQGRLATSSLVSLKRCTLMLRTYKRGPRLLRPSRTFVGPSRPWWLVVFPTCAMKASNRVQEHCNTS